MRALTLDPHLQLRDVPEPEPGPGEARIRVLLAGICRTDVELVQGYMGFRGTLGHEFVGVVEACDETGWVGSRVCGEINLGCGACGRCRSGLARHCAARRVLGILDKDGCFAEYVTLPIRNLVRLPAAVDDETAVFVEPLAAAFEILEQIDIEARDRVLVLGDGKLGLLICMALAPTGCDLHALGRHPEKLAIAERAGAHTWTPAQPPDDEFDVVVEATGGPDGFERAVALTRPRGTLVLKSTLHEATPFRMAPVVIDELTIVGSRCGPFGPAVTALASGAVNPAPLISATFGLEYGLRALEHAREPGVLKVLLRP